MERMCCTSGSRRHSRRTPWPTMPVAPKRITFMGSCYSEDDAARCPYYSLSAGECPKMSNSRVPHSDREMRPLLWVFAIAVFGFNAIAAKAEVSAHDILQHFYRAAGGRAWQRFEECDSTGIVTLSQKTGT